METKKGICANCKLNYLDAQMEATCSNLVATDGGRFYYTPLFSDATEEDWAIANESIMFTPQNPNECACFLPLSNEDQIKALKTKLEKAEIELQKTSEYKLLLSTQAELEKAEVGFRQKVVAEAKEKMIEHGFECRTGHSTGSTNHREWQSDDGEPFTCLIVHKSLPKIFHVSEYSKDVLSSIEGIEKQVDIEYLSLGHRETEEEAWESASEDIDLIQEVLENTNELNEKLSA